MIVPYSGQLWIQHNTTNAASLFRVRHFICLFIIYDPRSRLLDCEAPCHLNKNNHTLNTDLDFSEWNWLYFTTLLKQPKVAQRLFASIWQRSNWLWIDALTAQGHIMSSSVFVAVSTSRHRSNKAQFQLSQAQLRLNKAQFCATSCAAIHRWIIYVILLIRRWTYRAVQWESLLTLLIDMDHLCIIEPKDQIWAKTETEQ